MSNIDATRVMGATTGDRTMVVPGGVGGATMQMPGGGDAFRTQMGGTTTCPVCKSTTPLMEPYCGDCGFLLTSSPAEEIALPSEERPVAELVDLQDGRRYRLRMGVNTLGRQGTDVLVNEGTVSRNHANITVSESGILIEDLGSSNGTKVGDLRLGPNQPTAATPGTPLRFGNWRVTLEAGGAVGGSADQTIVVSEADRTIVGMPTGGDPSATPMEEASPGAVEETGPAIAILKKLDGPASDIRLPEGTVTLGRRTGATLVLNQDAYLSGRHAEIVTDPTGTYLTDVGSTNGTFVNGQRLVANERQLLLDGDEIQLGQTKYQFETLAPETSQETVVVEAPSEGAALETSITIEPTEFEAESESH